MSRKKGWSHLLNNTYRWLEFYFLYRRYKIIWWWQRLKARKNNLQKILKNVSSRLTFCLLRRRSIVLWWWQRLWIRKDELHPSLNVDFRIYTYLTPEEKMRYTQGIGRRRREAHKRCLKSGN